MCERRCRACCALPDLVSDSIGACQLVYAGGWLRPGPVRLPRCQGCCTSQLFRLAEALA